MNFGSGDLSAIHAFFFTSQNPGGADTFLVKPSADANFENTLKINCFEGDLLKSKKKLFHKKINKRFFVARWRFHEKRELSFAFLIALY